MFRHFDRICAGKYIMHVNIHRVELILFVKTNRFELFLI